MQFEYYEVYGYKRPVHENSNLVVVARFFTEGDALRFIRSKEYNNFTLTSWELHKDEDLGKFIKKTYLEISETIDDYFDHKNRQLYLSAISKLSVEERKSLGLC